jgi:nucleoside-diphosphate-sugar epimerase
VTGAAGTVGSALIRRLLEDPEWRVTALVRPGGSRRPVGRLREDPRLTVVEGDVTEPGLGWTRAELRERAATTTHVCHLAASTRFDTPLQQMRALNVRGTERVLEFAARCPRLQQFGLASTAYVSGRRTGPVLESELVHDAGFVNAYEQSKYEAELLAHDFADRVPVAIYRISTILGHSRSGAVRHHTAPHQALRIMSLGLASMLPGTPDYVVNLVPSDAVARALARLLREPAPAPRTYHLTAPPEKCFTLREMIDEGYRHFARLIPDWERRDYPKPAIVNRKAFDRFMDSVEQTGNPFLMGVTGALRHFAHQLLYPKEFDRTNTQEAWPEYAEWMPDVRSYFGRVVERCVSTGWGSREEVG